MSINDEWVRYLRASGYTGSINDMIRADLQAQTGSSSKHPNTLWMEYLTGQGYSGQVNDMMYQWLGSKGYTGSLNDRWMAALKADDVFGWTPDKLISAGAQAFWSMPQDVDAKTQDIARETPANTEGEPVGSLLNMSSKSVIGNAEQATTLSKPLVTAGNSISRSFNDARVLNLSDMTVSLETGFTFAARYSVNDGNSYYLFTGTAGTVNSLSVYGTAGSVTFAWGSASLGGSWPGVSAGTPINVIVTADTTGLNIYYNGTQVRNYNSTIAGSGSDPILLNYRRGSSFGNGSVGNMAVLPVSLRGDTESIAKLNEWLGSDPL